MELIACEECAFAANQPTRLRCAVCRRPLRGGLPQPERRRRTNPAATRVWRRDLLLRQGARPFPLAPNSVTRIGRGTECEVRVSSARVSRVHAELRWEGQELRIRDLGSHNGTRVNERRVDDVVLADGDRIAIGPYRCVYRRLSGVSEEVQGRVGTELEALLSHEGAFQTELAEQDLLELLQALEVQERSGTLSVLETEADDGELVVAAGRLVFAQCGRLSGEQALRALLRRERGRLRFVAETSSELRPNIEEDSLQTLLLEAARAEDGMLTSKFSLGDLLDLDEEGAPLLDDAPDDETSPELPPLPPR